MISKLVVRFIVLTYFRIGIIPTSYYCSNKVFQIRYMTFSYNNICILELALVILVGVKKTAEIVF